jgi:hypothetical protein
VIDAVCALAAEQAGVIGRAQFLALGLTPAQARAHLDSARWRALSPGVYLTHRGELPAVGQVWAALLAAGPGAVAGPLTTLWLQGVISTPPRVVDVWVPHERRVRSGPGWTAFRRRGLADDTHRAARPPQLRLECAVLDVARRTTRSIDAIHVVVASVQRRRTTAARLLAALDDEPRHARRRLVTVVLSDVRDGVLSELERQYVRRVERAHGLPRGVLNAAEHDGVSRRYRDVRYRRYRVVVELDGREAHPDDERFRDRDRDDRVAVEGDLPLRYGWREVDGEPCGVAIQLVRALRLGGWEGSPRPCSRSCPLREANELDRGNSGPA